MRLFRGILSMLFNPTPDESKFRRGLLILSCSEENAMRIRQFARERCAGIDWTILYRYDAGGVFKGENIIFSSDARSIPAKIALLRKIRSEKYDVVYVAWTNEPSYGLLKMFGLLSNFGYLRIFNEHLGAFYFVRDNYENLKRHLLWRWQSGHDTGFVAKNSFSWIVLMPLGFLYLVAQTIRYGITGLVHSRQKNS